MVSGMIFKQGSRTSKAFTRTNFTKIEIGNLAKNGKYLDDFGKPSVYQNFLDDMHPILKKRFEKHLEEISKGLNATADDIIRAAKPGSHGEIRALDDLLKT